MWATKAAESCTPLAGAASESLLAHLHKLRDEERYPLLAEIKARLLAHNASQVLMSGVPMAARYGGAQLSSIIALC